MILSLQFPSPPRCTAILAVAEEAAEAEAVAAAATAAAKAAATAATEAQRLVKRLTRGPAKTRDALISHGGLPTGVTSQTRGQKCHIVFRVQ